MTTCVVCGNVATGTVATHPVCERHLHPGPGMIVPEQTAYQRQLVQFNKVFIDFKEAIENAFAR